MADTDKPEKTAAFSRICRLAGKAVGRYRMIAGGEKILVGVSGGKDSLMLMHVLAYMQRRSPVKFQLVPAVFDPGFPGFGLDVLQEYCRKHGWELQVLSLNMEQIIREKNIKSPCMMCSRLRRGLLYSLAGKLNCSRLALGQHLDDIEASFLMSLARGQGITTMGPNVPAESAGLRVIRPLALVPEALIKEAAAAFNLPVCGKCIYEPELDRDGDRAYFKKQLDMLEARIPHVRSNILRSLGNIQTEYLLDERFLTCILHEGSKA